MPFGSRRFQQAESLHFITFSCFQRLPYLASAEAKDVVQTVLEETRARHGARVYAYVVMPNHVHLVMNEPLEILVGQFLKVLKQATSRRLKGERERFWQVRYYDGNLGGDEMTDVIRYIHRNPVKKGLVSAPEEYRWSSYNHYRTGERGVVEIESEWTGRWREGGVGLRLWADPLIAVRLR